MTLLDYLISLNYDKKNAEAFIRAGKVTINKEVVFIPSQKIDKKDKIEIKQVKKWVSRGAYKLLGAIKEFDLDFENKIILDIGSSTGGFTHVALEKGANKVYALDVGKNQLDYKLRSDRRVIVYEKTNLKTINPSMFNEDIDIVLADVSFISLKNVFKVINNLESNKIKIIALIKPQFEANSNQVEPGGFVPETLHEDIIKKVKGYAKEFNFKLNKIAKSQIKGNKSKNQEYISIFER